MPRVKRLDLLLERGRNISQIILVGLVIFGYLYTVRPIYRNQLLSEELSRKTMDMREKEEAISQLDNTRIKLEGENEKLQKNNEIIAKEIQTYRKKSIKLKTNIMNLLLSDVKLSMILQINTCYGKKMANSLRRFSVKKVRLRKLIHVISNNDQKRFNI